MVFYWFIHFATESQTNIYIYWTGNIPHGLNWSAVSKISHKSYGSYTDGTNWYGVIYASSVAIAGQISFYVTPTNIVIVGGGGAPAITSEYVVLEYISNF